MRTHPYAAMWTTWRHRPIQDWLHSPVDRLQGSEVSLPFLFLLGYCSDVFLMAVALDSTGCHVALFQIVCPFANRCLTEYE